MNINFIKPFFPHAFKANDVKSLVIALVIYAVVAWVSAFVLGILSGIWIIGFVFAVVAWAVRLYCVAGIILSLLYFLKIIK